MMCSQRWRMTSLAALGLGVCSAANAQVPALKWRGRFPDAIPPAPYHDHAADLVAPSIASGGTTDWLTIAYDENLSPTPFWMSRQDDGGVDVPVEMRAMGNLVAVTGTNSGQGTDIRTVFYDAIDGATINKAWLGSAGTENDTAAGLKRFPAGLRWCRIISPKTYSLGWYDVWDCAGGDNRNGPLTGTAVLVCASTTAAGPDADIQFLKYKTELDALGRPQLMGSLYFKPAIFAPPPGATKFLWPCTGSGTCSIFSTSSPSAGRGAARSGRTIS